MKMVRTIDAILQNEMEEKTSGQAPPPSPRKSNNPNKPSTDDMETDAEIDQVLLEMDEITDEAV